MTFERARAQAYKSQSIKVLEVEGLKSTVLLYHQSAPSLKDYCFRYFEFLTHS